MTAWVIRRADLLPGHLSQIQVGRAGEPRYIGEASRLACAGRSELEETGELIMDGGLVGK